MDCRHYGSLALRQDWILGCSVSWCVFQYSECRQQFVSFLSEVEETSKSLGKANWAQIVEIYVINACNFAQFFWEWHVVWKYCRLSAIAAFNTFGLFLCVKAALHVKAMQKTNYLRWAKSNIVFTLHMFIGSFRIWWLVASKMPFSKHSLKPTIFIGCFAPGSTLIAISIWMLSRIRATAEFSPCWCDSRAMFTRKFHRKVHLRLKGFAKKGLLGVLPTSQAGCVVLTH